MSTGDAKMWSALEFSTTQSLHDPLAAHAVDEGALVGYDDLCRLCVRPSKIEVAEDHSVFADGPEAEGWKGTSGSSLGPRPATASQQ
jgi:hypothetical protein